MITVCAVGGFFIACMMTIVLSPSHGVGIVLCCVVRRLYFVVFSWSFNWLHPQAKEIEELYRKSADYLFVVVSC